MHVKDIPSHLWQIKSCCPQCASGTVSDGIRTRCKKGCGWSEERPQLDDADVKAVKKENQKPVTYNGLTRFFVFHDGGKRGISWAKNEEEAWKKGEKAGWKVERIEYAASLSEQKDMSAYNTLSGGALVPPPAMPKGWVTLRRNIRRKRMEEVMRAKGIFSSVQAAGNWLAAKWAQLEKRYMLKELENEDGV